jgi:hypothetical protein
MHAAILECPTTPTCERSNLSTLGDYLEHHPHFKGRLSDVSIDQEGRTLVLSGRLPSFYLKQLLQEAVRHVPGVGHVRNQIDVVCPEGISSVRC